jgi:hypothetical protein
MNRTLRLALLLSPIALAASGSPARADTDGLCFGIDLHSSRFGGVEVPDNPAPDAVFVDETGGGANLWIGWGFTRSFPVRLSIAGAAHDTSDPDIEVAYGSVTIDGMYLFRDPEPLRPYLYGGIGGFALRSRRDALDWETTGPGILLGGGLLYFFGDTFALDFSVRGEFVNWEKTRSTWHTGVGDITAEIPIEEEGSAAKFLVGASWWL